MKLNEESVVAYPTESVFGLGCDPDSEKAVKKLLKLKKRPIEKGLILVSSDYNKLLPYLAKEKISNKQIKLMFNHWPGPVSFSVPAANSAPKWLTGNGKFNSIVIRVSNHIGIIKLCQKFGKPIISTSANIHGFLPCRTAEEVKLNFGKNFPILLGNTYNRTNPSKILNILTGDIIRKG